MTTFAEQMARAEGALSPPQLALYRLMSRISEQLHCAGWIDGNEFMLWDALVRGDDEIERDDLAQLRHLSNEGGGWIVWREFPVDQAGPVFVPMVEWLDRYARGA